MHFRKLEVVGFKSFLNKTKLKFEPGVTAIVGPNGCGKSNVVDAIKWVLGEQSTKSMRSTSMQDVIFNGTEKHASVNVAEVSLTLSNENRLLPVDYDEVIISRRLYRSGESEYLLNKTPVRLSDVKNILMGTGMGTSSYSVVEQGKMDMILSSKPEERRYIFEEASGITRYKAQKREAILKLERTQENLTRINDITREVERQINSIERKARKAERYKSRYEELKDLDIKLAHKKYKELATDDASLFKSSAELKSLEKKLTLELEESTVLLNKTREEFNAIFEELQSTQNKIMQLTGTIDKNNHTIGMNTERIKELKKQIERMSWEIDEIGKREEALTSRLNSMEDKFSGVSEKRRNKAGELSRAEEAVKNSTQDIDKYKHELKFNREKTIDMITDQTKTKNMIIKINANMQNSQARRKRLVLEKNSVQTEKDNIEEELKDVETRGDVVSRDLEAKREEYRVFNAEYASRQHKLSGFNSDRNLKEKRINEIRPRRQFIEKLILEREGINSSVKNIMKQVEEGNSVFSGVHGILSELISINETHEESLRSILGDTSQSVVVETLECAERVIMYLEENSLESVNFIILEELGKLSADNGVYPNGVVLDNIAQVIKAKEPHHSALRTYFNDTFVTVSSDAAKAYMIDNDDFMGRIIGERGEVYKKGLRRSRNFSEKEIIPLFGRKEKAVQLKEEENNVSSEIEKINSAIVELENWIKEGYVRKDRIENELREKQSDFSDITSKKAIVKEKFNSLSEELMLLDTEIEEEVFSIKQMVEENNHLEQTLKRLDSENCKVQVIIEESQSFIQENTRKREETIINMSDIKAELSALVKEEENLSENLERDREAKERITNEIEERHVRCNESEIRIETLEKESFRLECENKEFSSTLEEKNSEISGRRDRKEDLSHEIRRKEAQVKIKEKELEDTRNRSRDTDINKKEIEYKRSGLAEKIYDTYKVNILEFNVEVPEDTNWDEMRSKIEELKAQLEKMGEVSLGAVEEHKQLEARFEFLTKHRDDLVDGREKLLKAIAKINRTTRKLFMETFEAIRKEFNNYFRMLFNGGKAELVLEDESNMLECGIDIVVRPPGKKLHNIMQLSGGEKAMTAIALIFAIFKVNPSPFCILDEIDAPLDESNIVRFCSVLQEFLKLSQFIIVTHNRMTIQLADVLYGITMEEKGVSKVVSVKFSEESDDSVSETVASAV